MTRKELAVQRMAALAAINAYYDALESARMVTFGAEESHE